MASIIQLRRGTAAEWTAANPILAEGEVCVELDTSKCKVGDGIRHWNALDYSIGATGPTGVAGRDGIDGINGRDGADGQDGSPGPAGPMGGTPTSFSRLTMQGNLTPTIGTNRWYPSTTVTIVGISANVGIAPTTTVTVNVKKNNSTIQQLIIAPSSYRSGIFSTISLALGVNDFITADIVSATDGANLNVVLEYITNNNTVPFITRLNYIGILKPAVGVARWYPTRTITISKVSCAMGVPSTEAVYANVLLNGAVILSLAIEAATYKSATLSDLHIAMTAYDYLTVNILTADSGQDLAVVIEYL